MKYSLLLLVSTVSLISAKGKIPDYIQICKRNNPQLTECIHDSILSLKDKLVEGIPELDVPSIDPLYLEKFDLNLGPGLKAEGRNLLIRGGKNFKIHDLVVDVDANTYSFTVSVPEITADGTYDIDAAIASIPLKGTGPAHLTAKSVIGRATLRGRKVMRGGKTYNWFPSMNMKIEVGDYEIKLENLFQEDPTIAKVTNKLLNDEKAQVLASFLPDIERAMTEHVLLSANNICKHFTWDELFPES